MDILITTYYGYNEDDYHQKFELKMNQNLFFIDVETQLGSEPYMDTYYGKTIEEAIQNMENDKPTDPHDSKAAKNIMDAAKKQAKDYQRNQKLTTRLIEFQQGDHTKWKS